jgi:methyl-accepting chemotaxis protein
MDHENCEKVIRLEAMVEEMKEKVSHFDKVPEALAELSTTLRYQSESNDRRDILLQEQTKTLNEISTNTRLQTQTIEKLNEKIDETNATLNEKIDNTNQKVCDLAKQVDNKDKEDDKKWSIHFADIWKWLFWAIMGGAATILIPKLFDALGK